MRDLIDRQAALDALAHDWDGMVTSVFDTIKRLPPAEPEYLYIVMDKVKKHYEKAMSMHYIRNPMAWAIYETWKEYDK